MSDLAKQIAEEVYDEVARAPSADRVEVVHRLARLLDARLKRYAFEVARKLVEEGYP